MRDPPTPQDAREQYPMPPFPQPAQAPPDVEAAMQIRPDYEEQPIGAATA